MHAVFSLHENMVGRCRENLSTKHCEKQADVVHRNMWQSLIEITLMTLLQVFHKL